MIRTRNSLYVFSENQCRSKTTLKYKKRLEMDVDVIDITQGNGKDTGCIVYVCQTNGHRFNVVQNETLEQRMHQFASIQ